jgi:GABA permease
MHSGAPEAEQHMERAVERLRREEALEIQGKVGDPDPVAAVEDAVNFDSYDEIIVSTLPTHLSKWLKLDLPHRVERATGLPVRHVIASEPKAGVT